MLGIEVPTREEMREIESSNRLYEENGALHMTATMVTKLDTDLAESTQVTFILSGSRLVTNRYTDPLPFRASQPSCRPTRPRAAPPRMLLAGSWRPSSTVSRMYWKRSAATRKPYRRASSCGAGPGQHDFRG